jgi:RHS repeat-associated protein
VTGSLDTDKLFTGQRFDDSGLYFYNARYYDATIGRFISADSIAPDPFDPQSLNRYTYCLNNPLSIEQEECERERPSPLAAASAALTLNYASCAGGWQQAASAREASWVSSGPTEAARGLARGIGGYWAVLTHWPNIRIEGLKVWNSALRIPGGSRYFHIDGPHGKVNYWHPNADIGLGKWLLDHKIKLPSSVGRLAEYAKPVGKALVVVGAALDAYDIYSCIQADRAAGYGSFGPETREAVGRVVGGWGGALALAAVGTAVCPVFGTIALGIAGAIGGSKLGEWIASWFD